MQAVNGPPPKPAVLRVRRPDKSSSGFDAPEFDPQGVPLCPPYLAPEARAVWDEVVPTLVERGTVRGVDAQALAMYCENCALYWWAVETYRREGRCMLNRRGNLTTHPAVGIARTAAKIADGIGAQYGLTACTRTRVKETAKPTETKGKKYFG